MRVFAVSGFSFSGKTFLLEQLISKLKGEGKTVACVKSTKDDIVAPEGTDTWRHAQAGANPTILMGPSTATLRIKGPSSISRFEKIVDADFLLLEGFKDLDIPRFWCIGEEEGDTSYSPKQVKAYVVWEGVHLGSSQDGVPIIPNSEIDRLVDIMKQYAIDYSSFKEIS